MAYLVLFLVFLPLLAAGAIAFIQSYSLLSPLLVLAGILGGTITVIVSGLSWLQSLHSEWMQSQAAGFVLLPVVLPFYAYVGAVAGASLVAMLYGYQKHHSLSGWFIAAAIGLTIIVAGFMPAALLTMQPAAAEGRSISTSSDWFWVALPLVTAAMGTASAWLSSAFTFWVFSLCRLVR